MLAAHTFEQLMLLPPVMVALADFATARPNARKVFRVNTAQLGILVSFLVYSVWAHSTAAVATAFVAQACAVAYGLLLWTRSSRVSRSRIQAH